MFGTKISFSQRLGVYKFLPLFFVIGAGIELFMIKVRVGRETFCKYFSAKLSETSRLKGYNQHSIIKSFKEILLQYHSDDVYVRKESQRRLERKQQEQEDL